MAQVLRPVASRKGSRRNSRARRRLRLLQRASWMLVLMLLASAAPAGAVTPPGSLDVPDPPDWGVLEGLRSVQANETDALGEASVVAAATEALSEVEAFDAARSPPVGPFDLHTSEPFTPQQLDLEESIRDSPYTNLTNFLAILLDQPLKFLVRVKSGDHTNWIEILLRPYIDIDFSVFPPRIINWQRWEEVNIDNDTSTGEGPNGHDIRIRLRPILENRNINATPLQRNVTIQLSGGFAAEIERIGTEAEDLPLETTFIKTFRYSNINYTWFLEHKIDRIPDSVSLSLTADQINVSSNPESRRQLVIDIVNAIINQTGNVSITNRTGLADISGPYTISHVTSGTLQFFQGSLGYIRIHTPSPTSEPELTAASWLTAKVTPSDRYAEIPRRLSLWLDSPAFNRTFDNLNWTATRASKLDLEYYDDRPNATMAKGGVHDIPSNFRVEIKNVTEEVGPVSKVHYTTSEPIDLIYFDEWEFVDENRDRYLHSHVELREVPEEIWLNGTLDIGGKAYDPLRPDPTVRQVIPQLLDGLMVRIASKLFTIGRTLRSLPQNILNMPDRAGYTQVDMPIEGTYLGKLEFWLTSDHYVMVEPDIDFFAFYNDTVEELEGNMIQTAFSGRLLDIRSVYTTFYNRKHVELDSRYNRELRALFIDEKNDANASLWFSNIPHNISLELTDEALTYEGDGSVDRVQYISAIEDQYLRMLLEGVPESLVLDQGEDMMGFRTLVGSLASIDLQVTNGRVRRMMGDHLLVEIGADGRTAASLHLSGLSQFRYDRVGNDVELRSGGEPFKLLIDDETRDFDLRAHLAPLPPSISATSTDILGIGEIQIPSLQEVTSVLDFAAIIYAISDLGDDVIRAVGELSTNAVAGLGTFSSDLEVNYTGTRNMDMVATVHRGGPVPVEPATWVHGAVVHQVPSGDDVLMDAKVFITGLPPTMDLQLQSEGDTTNLNMDMTGFAPSYDHLTLVLDGASQVAEDDGRDIALYLEGLGPSIDLHLNLGLRTDMRIGGEIYGSITLEASHALGPLHVRLRTRQGNVATVEALLSRVPSDTRLSWEYMDYIRISTVMSEGLDFLFVKLSRDLAAGLTPASTITLHEVPPSSFISVEPPAEFDMDADSPVTNLPKVTIDASGPGMDVLADLKGRAMGSKADIYLDLRDVQGVSLITSDEEYRLSAKKASFLHLRVLNMPYSDQAIIDRIDLAVADLRRATLKVHMVFGVYPLVTLSDLKAGGLQVTMEGSLRLGKTAHDLDLVILEVPTGLSGTPKTHSNGVSLRSSDGDSRMLVPAPMSTLLGTLLD